MILSTTESVITAVICAVWLGLIAVLLPHLRDEGLQNPEVRPGKSERKCPFLAAVRTLGATIMSALDDALARFTAFVTDVVGQLKGAKEANDAQTGKLAELQAALDAALSDDAADKATIAALQAEIAALQDEVAAKINAAVDALENAPVAADETAPGPVAADEAAPVVETTEAPVVETPEAPVE